MMSDSPTASSREGLRNPSKDSSDVKRYYDEWADDYDRTLLQWRYEAPREAARRLYAILPTKAMVLDVGCGTGLSGRALVDAGFTNIDGLDISRRSFDIAEQRGIYRNLTQVNMQRLPLPYDDDSYQGMVCVGVLTYVPDSEGILREFCRILKSGGYAVITQRDDVLEERRFVAILESLEEEGILRDTEISAPMPYLPENEDFGDEVHVHYITFRTT